jgi:hypothetical protein
MLLAAVVAVVVAAVVVVAVVAVVVVVTQEARDPGPTQPCAGLQGVVGGTLPPSLVHSVARRCSGPRQLLPVAMPQGQRERHSEGPRA